MYNELEQNKTQALVVSLVIDGLWYVIWNFRIPRINLAVEHLSDALQPPNRFLDLFGDFRKESLIFFYSTDVGDRSRSRDVRIFQKR